MARLPRITVPGIARHATQRGNRRQNIFLEEDDFALYRDLLAHHCVTHGVAVWSYCLMPNHIHHLIMVLSTQEGLSRAIGETHRRYTVAISTRGFGSQEATCFKAGLARSR